MITSSNENDITYRVVSSDGLGNQLFQLAYAHHLGSLTGKTVGIIGEASAFHVSRPFQLDSILKNCKKVSLISGPQATRLRIVADRVKIASRKNLWLGRVYSLFYKVILETKEYGSKNSLKPGIHVGYFQNQIFTSNSDCLFDDIRTGLGLTDELTDRLAIHIRGGDFRNLKSMFGLLDSSYYSRALESILATGAILNEMHVVTDDVELALEVTKPLKLKIKIYGPEELGTLESFRFLASSKFLIVGNSTFAWWAARLAIESGGLAWKPNPWFLNYKDTNGSFDFPNMTNILSTFSD